MNTSTKMTTSTTLPMRVVRAWTIALCVGSSVGCFETRLDAISGRPAGGEIGGSDGGDSATAEGTRAPDASAATSPEQPPTAACVPGADTEREPNDALGSATPSAANAICGAAAGSDVDFFRVRATDGGAMPQIQIELLGRDGGLNAALFSEATPIGSASVQGTSGSVSLASPAGTMGDAIVQIAPIAGASVAYVVRVTR